MSTVLESGTALEKRTEAAVTPMTLIEMAATRGASIEQMQQLFDLQVRWEQNEARKAFVDAMAAFKMEAIAVAKDKVNKQYDSRYSSISSMVNTVNPFLGKHGLSAEWEMDQTSGIKVTCVLTHRLGHSKRVTLTVPPDTSGAKNPLQQIKSSLTYAKIATFEAACGIASAEGNLDDDGNGAGGAPRMSDEDFLARRDAIEAATTVDQLKTFYMASASAAEKIGDKQAVKDFAAAKDKRWKELKGVAR